MIDRETRNRHPEGLTTAQERLATELFEIGVFTLGEFKLKSHQTRPEAPLSPIYCNLRVLPLWPDVLKTVANIYHQLAVNVGIYEACMGVPDAGVPLATAFSLKAEIPQIVMRKTEKTDYGIIGQFLTPVTEDFEGAIVLVIDDLMTTAESKEEAIDKLEKAKFRVSDVVVLIDRDQNGQGKARLAARGVSFRAAYTIDQLLDYYARTGKITNEELSYSKNRLAILTEYLERNP